eukprot:1955780-Pyramimonas_sp.AAC.1
MLQSTIERVKERLQSNCGTSPSMMQLQLKDYSGQVVYEMNDDSKKLGYYSPQDGYVSTKTSPKTQVSSNTDGALSSNMVHM